MTITYKDYDYGVLSRNIQSLIDEYYFPNKPYSKRRIKIVLQAIKPRIQEQILDIGCGVGTFAFHCAKQGARTFGIDYSPESIKTANKLCEQFGVSQNTSFLIANGMKLPFKDAYFDKIIAADFIEHITHNEKDMLLQEIYRALKPEGLIIIFTPNAIREKIGELYWKIRNILFRNKIPVSNLHYGLINKSDFANICAKNNFRLKLCYKDITRPFLANIPLLRRSLALNLLFTLKK